MSRGQDPRQESPDAQRERAAREREQRREAEARRPEARQPPEAKGGAAPDQQHAIDEGDDVWNVTAKAIRMPNDQVIRAHSKSHIQGWGIWMYDDVVKSWLATGALTETDPEAPPDPPAGESGESVEGQRAGKAERAKRLITRTTTPLSPVWNVFTGQREPAGTSGRAKGGRLAKARYPGPETEPGRLEAPRGGPDAPSEIVRGPQDPQTGHFG